MSALRLRISWCIARVADTVSGEPIAIPEAVLLQFKSLRKQPSFTARARLP